MTNIRNTKIFLVDNDDLLLDLLQAKFIENGFDVETAQNGKIAWDRILATLPDLVVLDRMMPGMDGLAILKNMRTESGTKNIPAIVLSARGEDRDIEIGMKIGAQAYLTKPCDPDILIEESLKLLRA